MSAAGRAALVAAAALGALAPVTAGAVTLDEAIALALKHDPGLRRAAAEQDVAQARVGEAEAGRLPSVTLQASISSAPTDFGGFFGIPASTLTPRTASVELRQPLFRGGAVVAAIGRAKAGEAAARLGVESARLGLIANVAATFEAVRVAQQAITLDTDQVNELTLVVQQAQRRFDDGEAPKTDLEQARARLDGAEGDLANAEGALAVAEARYESLVGEPAAVLDAAAPPDGLPADVNQAVAQARAHNPGLAAAQFALDGADQGVREAKAARAPSLDLVAGASSVRDVFLPGYRADQATIGVEARWAIFTGGLTTGRIHEAAAQRGAAAASLEETRDQVDEAAIDAWNGLVAARAVSRAAQAQSVSADAALASVREEVRVGEKPTLDLLNAEREALAAHIGALKADGAIVAAAYRLKAVTGS